MGILDLLGMNPEKMLSGSPEDQNKKLGAILGYVKPMMEKRNLKTIILVIDKEGNIQTEMLEHNILESIEKMKDHIAHLNGKLNGK